MGIVDLTIYESKDGGDLLLINDDLATISGLTNQPYLALLGGVESEKEWWANDLINDSENKFISTFEEKLKTVSLNSAGLVELENAALADLEYLKKYANIEVEASLTDVNRLKLEIKIQEPDSKEDKIVFIWDGTKQETIIEN